MHIQTVLALAALASTGSAQAGIFDNEICPKPYPPPPTIAKEFSGAVEAAAGRILKAAAVSVGIELKSEARELSNRYKDFDRVYLLQNMASAYCKLLQDPAIAPRERADRWKDFMLEHLKGVELKESTEPLINDKAATVARVEVSDKCRVASPWQTITARESAQLGLKGTTIEYSPQVAYLGVRFKAPGSKQYTDLPDATVAVGSEVPVIVQGKRTILLRLLSVEECKAKYELRVLTDG